MSSVGTRVFVARLAGTNVFDPLGDQVGRVRDVVVLVRPKGLPRAVGLVVEVAARRRVFLPLTRVTAIDSGQVISTGLVNMRRFEQRAFETLAVGELLDRTVEFVDGSGQATIEDVAIELQRNGDWVISKVFVRRIPAGRSGILRRRGETLLVSVDEVTGLGQASAAQGAELLLAQYEDLKPADLADVLHDLGLTRRLEVASALDNERLADVLEELPEDDQVGILQGLALTRAADVLEAMQPDDAADLLGELPDDQAAELLELMEPDEAKDVRRLLAYEDNTAGGLMTTEPVILGPETPIAAALAHVRRQDLTPALASMVFVARPPLETPTGRFIGVVHLQRLLREPPHEAIGSIVDTDIESITVDAPLLSVTRNLATYNLLALPVVDTEKRLLGVVSVDDVLDHLLPEDWRETDDEGNFPDTSVLGITRPGVSRG
ncbi:magnesium transporter MgtE N-terminal domain-containing protein [Cellulomonas humilata]|uniref:Flagellar motility protein MotE (MotC chaperone)/sporulation protein YlmC with PRC-barrel domain n=1 Tax=Cellulomonas humilata TaxID=144055 RepID=A0ABU0ECV5_9CELL|nr:CBS domain-containing protein [Cellulomonas humilata]MDQ0373096.1 flagellar motility protein MotE (MotC chaperone)/sporulation protein YlmC with PRC-barrel domain [Cellulomonas humilata]